MITRSLILAVLVPLACAGDGPAGAPLDSTSTGPTTDAPAPTEAPTTGDPTTTAPHAATTTTGDPTGDADDPTTTSGSGGAGPICGDAIVDPGEACDDGFAGNTLASACLPDCTQAACGDGLVHEGVEQCDLAAANSYDYGGCVPGTCFWGPQCGDGVVTPGHELCDPGAPVDPDGEVVPCDAATCRFAGRVVFLSSATWNADLGGLSGADLKCQNLAKTFDPERFHAYRAWLSDSADEPAATFDHGPEYAETPYVLLNGVAVAASFEDLVASGTAVGITITDAYQSVIEARVWTHTTHAGERIPDDHHCAQWTTGMLGPTAMAGINALPDGAPDAPQWAAERWWTRHKEYPCISPLHLYCFEN